MHNEPLHYLNIIQRFGDKRVLVVGDCMTDVYLKGASNRLSPEAPVPVVDVTETVVSPGGAGNTALNLCALGATVSFFSVVGADRAADDLLHIFDRHTIDTKGVVRHPLRKTLVKTRVVAGNQVLIRYDEGTDTPIDDTTAGCLADLIRNHGATFDAVVVSDYNKGVVTEPVVAALQALRRDHNVLVAVDSKRLEFFGSVSASLAKPNYEEALALLGMPRQYEQRAEQIAMCGASLFEKTKATISAVTLDSDGVVVLERDKVVCRVAAPPVHTPSVAGAGDTFTSAFTLAVASGASATDAAVLAVAAATVAIQKETTTGCYQRELKFHFALREKYIKSLTNLAELCLLYRSEGKRIVFTNGCFDILHSGHVNYLHQAKALGDILIVGVNTDDSIRRIKGEQRPINPLTDRLQVLAGLGVVDHIVAFGEADDDTPIRPIAAARPDVFVKGGDYRKEDLPEAATVESCGGRIEFLPYLPDHSTTTIIQRINNNIAAVTTFSR